MSGKPSEDAGGGCAMVIAGLLLVGFVAAFWAVILTVLVVLGLLAAVLWGIGRAVDRRLERDACPVCQNWVASVVLTDLGRSGGPGASDLCRAHRPVHERIRALEAETFPDGPQNPDGPENPDGP